MIAKIQQTEDRRRSPRMRRAHRLVASTLLKKNKAAFTDNGSPVTAWRAWLFAAWMATATAAYAAYMAGLL